MSEQIPAAYRQRVMHLALSLPDGGQLLAADNLPGMGGNSLSGFAGFDLALEAAFKALAEGGSITMPMAPSFWVERFGVLTDRYGIGWMVNAGPSSL